MNTGFNSHTDAVLRKIHAAAIEGLQQAADELLKEANRTAPKDTGLMEAGSGTDVSPSTLEASVYYKSPYAPKQHEDTTLRHAPGRRARWLELAAQENAERLNAHVGATIREALR